LLRQEASASSGGGQTTAAMQEAAMKTLFACVLGLAFAEGAVAAQGKGVSVGISLSEGQLEAFHLAIGDHYGVPPSRVVGLRDRYRCRDEELPVAYFLAARARVEPTAVFELRARNRSWLDITFHYGLSPDIFFIPVRTDPAGPPYGKAYGYYRKRGAGNEWARAALSDSDLVALVNLRFLSERYGVPPESVMEMRGRQASFAVINDEIRNGKTAKANQKGKSHAKKK
jgi:hypothetical protein